MTTLRTDIIPNLYANPIQSISKASPAVVTVPVTTKIVSTTGTIGTVTGSGTLSSPWTATITNMTTTVGLISGEIITSTAGTGTFAAGGSVSIGAILGNQSISINKVGGTIPTAGTITNIISPARSTLPVFMNNGDPILFTHPGNRFTFNSTTGVFVANETFSQATSNATGIVTGVYPTYITYKATSGVVDTSHIVTGQTSGATTTPTTVLGMNQLLTNGVNGTNEYYANILTSTTFALYTDSGLTVPVDSSAFTTATPYAGQYTTFDTVIITTP
jgi:hypothetical protein